jgi:hypothetical protein
MADDETAVDDTRTVEHRADEPVGAPKQNATKG